MHSAVPGRAVQHWACHGRWTCSSIMAKWVMMSLQALCTCMPLTCVQEAKRTSGQPITRPPGLCDHKLSCWLLAVSAQDHPCQELTASEPGLSHPCHSAQRQNCCLEVYLYWVLVRCSARGGPGFTCSACVCICHALHALACMPHARWQRSYLANDKHAYMHTDTVGGAHDRWWWVVSNKTPSPGVWMPRDHSNSTLCGAPCLAS